MKFVCLEGHSGSGKTTQYHLLTDYYKRLGINCLSIVEKDYEPFGSVLRNWHQTKGPSIPFTKKDVNDFAKARAETFLHNFLPLKNKLDLLLMDRYFYTSAVYQKSCGLSPEEIFQINLDYGLPIPDLTFLFDCDPKTCFDRGNIRNRITGGKHYFSTSPERISEIRKDYFNLMGDRKEVKIIDSSKSIEEITKELINKINLKLF